MAPRVGNLEIPSYQQNGSFKINIGKAKKHLLLLTKKLQADLPYVIEKYDIISITNKVWRFSFAKIGSNRPAISERSWENLVETAIQMATHICTLMI